MSQQAQREYAPFGIGPKAASGLIGSTLGDVPLKSPPQNNVENFLSSCLNWMGELESEITNLADKLGPIIRPERPVDPSNLACEQKIKVEVSALASRLDALATRIEEQTRRIVVLKGLIDL